MPHAQTGFRRLRQRQDHPALFPHQARAEQGRRSILLVPEQFTSSTEGRIYRELGDALSGMVESFSFTSLAERILSAEGGAAVQTLSDAGRAVLVRGRWRSCRTMSTIITATGAVRPLPDGGDRPSTS